MRKRRAINEIFYSVHDPENWKSRSETTNFGQNSFLVELCDKIFDQNDRKLVESENEKSAGNSNFSNLISVSFINLVSDMIYVLG